MPKKKSHGHKTSTFNGLIDVPAPNAAVSRNSELEREKEKERAKEEQKRAVEIHK